MPRFSRDINTIDRYLRRKRREYMEPLGLKGIHARLVMAICRMPGSSQEQLARQLWFDKSTIARQVELLESLDFVERRPSQTDKRVLCVYPSQKMLEFQPGLRAFLNEWEATLLEDLTQEERATLIGLLDRIRAKTEVDE